MSELKDEVKEADGDSTENDEKKLPESFQKDKEINAGNEQELLEKEYLKVLGDDTSKEECDENKGRVEQDLGENVDNEMDGEEGTLKTSEDETLKASEEPITCKESNSSERQNEDLEESEVRDQEITTERELEETDTEKGDDNPTETETMVIDQEKESAKLESLQDKESKTDEHEAHEAAKAEGSCEEVLQAVPVEVEVTNPEGSKVIDEVDGPSDMDTEKTDGDADGNGGVEVIIADPVKPRKKRKIPHLHLGKRSQKKYYPSKHLIKLEITKGDRASKKRTEKCHDIAVYLIEKTGRLLTIEEGVGFTAGHLLNKMVENLSLPSEARQVFSIWLSSPFLELQLKPHHKPCALRRQWGQLLQRFTTATEEQIKRDEPILSFQRNVFFSLAEERKITEEGIIKRLFEEAKFNFLTCQYPVSQEDAEMLGSILVYIEHGAYDEQVHSTTEFLHHKLRNFLPSYTWKSPWPFVTYWTKRQEHQRLLDAYREMSSKLSTLISCHLAFLQFCWTLPFYGAVYFHGQVEQQATGYWHRLFGHPDILVRVAINTKGIHVIEDSSNEILLGLNLNDFSWDYVACDEHDEGCMDTLWLEYDDDDPEHGGHTISTQLPVFSKQAIMMDAMIETCTNCYLAGLQQQDGNGAFKRSHSKRMERVSVTAYTDEGEPFVRNKPTNFSLSYPLRRLREHSSRDQQETRQ